MQQFCRPRSVDVRGYALPLCCVEDARDQYRLARLRLLVQGDNEFHATSSATCYNLPQRSPYPIYAPQFA